MEPVTPIITDPCAAQAMRYKVALGLCVLVILGLLAYVGYAAFTASQRAKQATPSKPIASPCAGLGSAAECNANSACTHTGTKCQATGTPCEPGFSGSPCTKQA